MQNLLHCPAKAAGSKGGWEVPYLAHNSEPGVEVGQPSWRECGTTRGELQESLPLIRRHATQDSHKSKESRA